jgi:hypothetical protein
MVDTIIKILVIVGLIFLAYKLIFSGSCGLTIFEMHFKDGKLISHKGKIPERFQRECRAIAKSNKLTNIVLQRSGYTNRKDHVLDVFNLYYLFRKGKKLTVFSTLYKHVVNYC